MMTATPSCLAAAMLLTVSVASCGKASDRTAPEKGLAVYADATAQMGARRRLTIDVDAEMERARLALAKGEPQKAIAPLYAVTSELPKHLDAKVLLATAYSATARHAQALRQAQAALALDPRSKGAILAKGVALAGMARFQEAIQETREVTRRDPRHTGAWLNLAWFHGARKQWEKQEIVLDQLIGLEPDVVGHRVQRAKALARLGKLQQARAALEDAVQRVPHDAEAQLLFAAVLYEQGHMTDAMDRADIAARLDPERAQAVDLFRAAFYVAVASALQCKHGEPPWDKATVDGTLEAYRRQGIDNTEEFYEIHASYGSRQGVKDRITGLARACRQRPSSLPAK